jgi:hypothetical protein
LRHAPPAPAGYDPPLSQVLLVAALGSAALAIAVAIARATVGDAVVAPVVAASVRGASYLGLVLAVGGLAFTALIWPEGRGERRLASIVWLGWLTVGAATVLHLASHDAAGAAAPGDRIAAALGVRLALLLGAVVWVSAYLRRRPAPRAVGLALLAALACTWIYAGPVAPGPVTIVMTLLHLAAACVWAGGLAVLAAVLLPRGSTASLEGALGRFSQVATVCVGVLAVSGIYHAWTRAGQSAACSRPRTVSRSGSRSSPSRPCSWRPTPTAGTSPATSLPVSAAATATTATTLPRSPTAGPATATTETTGQPRCRCSGCFSERRSPSGCS